MIIIQFVDHNPIRNIAGCKITANDTIYFCGDKKVIDKVKPDYKRFLRFRGTDAKIVPLYLDNNDFLGTQKKLDELISQNKECIIDISGGDDLMLFTVGTLFEKYKDQNKNVQIQLIDFRDGHIVDIDGDGLFEKSNMPYITIEENIILRGGIITASNENNIYRESLDSESVEDIHKIWNVTRKYSKLWNLFKDVVFGNYNKNATNTLNNAGERCYVLNSNFAPEVNRRWCLTSDGRRITMREMLNELSNAHIIWEEYCGDGTHRLYYKSDLIKQCINMTGTPLELETYIAALSYKVGGEYYFDDVRTGVSIEWSEDSPFRDFDKPNNEIDVIASRGYDIYFISCKNGDANMNELYKLDTVAIKFGGIAAKKILIGTDISSYYKVARSYNKFLDRATEINIKVIDGAKTKNSANFSRVLDELTRD